MQRWYSLRKNHDMAPVELYDVTIVGGGPAGCALAGALSATKAFEGMSIALVDSGKLCDLREWKPPLDTYLPRTLQITASNKSFLEDRGLWDRCYTDRVQPYNRAVVTDALGRGVVDLAASDTPEPEQHGASVAYMVETKNFVSGLLQSINSSEGHVDIFERDKVVSIDNGSADMVTNKDNTISRFPVVNLSSKQKLRTRILVGADGVNSCVRKYAGIGTYGNEYSQFGLVATLCLEELNRTAYQRFLPTGPIAMLPFPGGFANLVWSLDIDLIQLLKAVPESLFACLVNAAFRLPPHEMQHLYDLVRDGASESEIAAETKWRLEVYERNNSGHPDPSLFPPKIAAISPKSRTSFPLRMRMVDNLTAERIALIGDAGHVMHPLAGQGLNMGLEDVQCLVDVLKQAVLAGEDIGACSVLSRYNKHRYVRNLAMQGIVDKIWHIFGTSSYPLVAARSLIMNGLDVLPTAKQEQLLSACMMDQSNLVEELLSSPQQVNVNFKNALDCVKLLTAAKGINPNVQDNMGKDTPLHKALVHCDSSETAMDIAKLLVGAGADPRIVNKKKQRPIDLTEPDEEDIRRLLLQATLAITVRQDQAELDEDDGSYSSD
ncbi:putative ubiquinone biosynthesis monooxygenase [Coemansia sp. RSA 1646]|nr:putative ubiquinone biosynthesis monooxygenase [Coemansia sp. RSA 1646]